MFAWGAPGPSHRVNGQAGACAAFERPWSLVTLQKRAAWEHKQEASDMLCWLLCKGKQVARARKGAKEGKSFRGAA